MFLIDLTVREGTFRILDSGNVIRYSSFFVSVRNYGNTPLTMFGVLEAGVAA